MLAYQRQKWVGMLFSFNSTGLNICNGTPLKPTKSGDRS